VVLTDLFAQLAERRPRWALHCCGLLPMRNCPVSVGSAREVSERRKPRPSQERTARLSHQGINAAELAFAATQALQSWFYRNYPPTPKSKSTDLAPSSLKPTRVHVENDTVAKIPAAVIEGDIPHAGIHHKRSETGRSRSSTRWTSQRFQCLAQSLSPA
jgi:hypothetical protein